MRNKFDEFADAIMAAVMNTPGESAHQIIAGLLQRENMVTVFRGPDDCSGCKKLEEARAAIGRKDDAIDSACGARSATTRQASKEEALKKRVTDKECWAFLDQMASMPIKCCPPNEESYFMGAGAEGDYPTVKDYVIAAILADRSRGSHEKANY